jgi:hypothetical protein
MTHQIAFIEHWKPVVGCEDICEVSDAGRVRSLDRVIERKDGRTYRHVGRILKLRLMSGTWRVKITIDCCKSRWAAISHLVYEAFVGFIDQGYVVGHGDCNPANNIPSNLFLSTFERVGRDTGKRIVSGEDIHTHRLTAKLVIALRNGEVDDTTVARECNMVKATVSNARRFRSWKHL